MKLSRAVAAGAMVGTMTAGGVAGALLFTPSVGGAQTEEEAPADDGSDGAEEMRHKGRFGHLGVVAETIGIEPEALREALADGQTIAEVAEANGVDPQTVIDALVAAVTERIEERLAELPERMEDLVNSELPDRPRFRGHRGPGFPGRGPGGFDRDADMNADAEADASGLFL